MENQIRKNPFLSKMIHHHQVINSQEKEAAKIAKKAVTIGVGGNHSIFQRFKTATRLSTKNELPGVEQVDSIFLDSFEIFYNVGYNKIENNGSKYESLQTIKESSSNDSTTKKYYIQGILHLPNIPKLDKKLIYTPIHNFKLHYNKDKKIWNPIVEIDGGKWVTILNPVPEYHPYYEQFDLMIQMGKQISKYLKEYPDPEDFDREVLFQKLRSNIDNFQEDILYAYLKEIFDIVKAQSSKVKESNIQILMTLLQCNSMEIFETNKSDVPMPDIPALTKPKPNQPTPTPTPTPLSTPPLTQTIQTPENVTQEKKKIKKKKPFKECHWDDCPFCEHGEMPSWCLTEKSFQLVYLAFYCVWKLSPKGTEFLATREVAEFAKVHKLIKDEHCKKVGDVFSSYKDIFLSGYDANKTPHGFWGLLKIFHKKDPWGFPDYLQERVTKKKLMEYLEIPEEKKKATKEISKSQISSFFSVIPHSQSQPSTPLPTPSNIRGPPTNVEDGTTTLYRSHKAYIKLISVENNQVAPSFRNSFQMNIKKSNVLKEIQLNHQYYLNRLCPELLRFSPYSSTATKANTQQPKLPEITGIGQSEFNYDIVPLLYCKGCGKAKMLEGATCQNTHLMKKSTQDSFADFLVHLEKHRAESLKILNETEFDILEKRESINLFETRSIVESLQEMNTPKENTKPTTFKAWP